MQRCPCGIILEIYVGYIFFLFFKIFQMVTKTKSEKITDIGRKNIERQKYRNERELLLALVIGQEAILSSSLSQTTITDNFINVALFLN